MVMKSRNLPLVAALSAAALAAAPVAAEMSAEELATVPRTSYPPATLISLPFRTTPISTSDRRGTQNILNISR
jgi:hypothetical protein